MASPISVLWCSRVMMCDVFFYILNILPSRFCYFFFETCFEYYSRVFISSRLVLLMHLVLEGTFLFQYLFASGIGTVVMVIRHVISIRNLFSQINKKIFKINRNIINLYNTRNETVNNQIYILYRRQIQLNIFRFIQEINGTSKAQKRIKENNGKLMFKCESDGMTVFRTHRKQIKKLKLLMQ